MPSRVPSQLEGATAADSRLAPRSAVETLPPYRAGRSIEDAMSAHGLEEAIKLASNESPFDPLPSVVASLAESASTINRYPDVLATPLREALARRLGLGTDWIAIGAGSAGLLWQLSSAFLESGAEVIVPWPSFEAYPIIARLADATPVFVPLAAEAADVDRIAEAIGPRTKMVLLADPNNPTGTVVGSDALMALARHVSGRCLLVIDEAYVEFVTSRDHGEAITLMKAHQEIVVLRTFSKAYGLAGLRVGYALAHPAVIRSILKVAVPFSVNALGIRAAITSLDAQPELDQRVAAVVEERERVERRLREAGLRVPVSEGNFIWLPARERSAQLATALERRGIVTRPVAEAGVRVTVGTPAENDRFLQVFTELIQEIPAMNQELDSSLPIQRHDVFDVMQLTRDTVLQSLVAADLVDVEPHQQSATHRHNSAETILYFLSGNGEVQLGEEHRAVAVHAGDRLRIPKGAYHAVRTAESPLRFLSVQCPPILDEATGVFDLEPLERD